MFRQVGNCDRGPLLDQIFDVVRTSKSVDRQISCSSETSIQRFSVSKMAKRLVREGGRKENAGASVFFVRVNLTMDN